MRSLVRGSILMSAIVATGWATFAGRATFVAFSFGEDKPEPSSTYTGCQLPEVKDVSSMTADLYCHPFGEAVGGDIFGFEIPKKYFSEVLAYFKDSECDNNVREELDLSEIGTIRVTLENGCCIRFCWFEVACKDRLHFSCAGRRYVHTGKWFANDETLSFDGYIRSLYQAEHEEQAAEQKAK